MAAPTLKKGTRPPWVGLGAAVWLQIASGNAYNFPLYSHSLKSVLGFNQHQLTLLGVANDVGENVGLLPGLVSNRLPPWAVLLVGSVACFLGYGVLWLAVTRTVQPLPYWLVSKWTQLDLPNQSFLHFFLRGHRTHPLTDSFPANFYFCFLKIGFFFCLGGFSRENSTRSIPAFLPHGRFLIKI